MRKTIIEIKKMKTNKKITSLSLYEYYFGRLCEISGIDLILIGDSMGNVLYGDSNTLSVSLEMVINHCKAIEKATQTPLLIADLPFLSYQPSIEKAVESAGTILKQSNIQGVKLEGCNDYLLSVIERFNQSGIPVMGHLGLTPQYINLLGGYSKQGIDRVSSQKILKSAALLEQAGCFSVVLENIPANLAKEITEMLQIPTIGIGAGPDTDGQILVLHDILGLNQEFIPKFVKQYLNLESIITEAIKKYRSDVETNQYPAK